jgi:hypothetical protein
MKSLVVLRNNLERGGGGGRLLWPGEETEEGGAVGVGISWQHFWDSWDPCVQQIHLCCWFGALALASPEQRNREQQQRGMGGVDGALDSVRVVWSTLEGLSLHERLRIIFISTKLTKFGN